MWRKGKSFPPLLSITPGMSFLVQTLFGKQIDAVMADSEVTYLMLADGTQVTIRGLVVVEPPQARRAASNELFGKQEETATEG